MKKYLVFLVFTSSLCFAVANAQNTKTGAANKTATQKTVHQNL